MNSNHQVFTVTDFNGGLSLGNPATIADNEFTQMENAVFSINKGFKARPGAEKLRLFFNSASMLTSAKPAGLVKSGDDIFLVTNGHVLNLTDGTTEVSYTLTETHIDKVPMYVIQYAGKFYIVGSPTVVKELVNTAGTWSESTIDASERLVASIFKDRMFFTRSANESRLYFSDIGDVATVGGTSYVDVEGNDSSPIRALVPFNDVLFIFKERSVWTLYANGSPANWTLRVADDSRGCLGPLSAAVVANQLYFTDASGFYVTDGVAYTQLGNKVFNDFISRQNYLNEVYVFEYRGNILLQARFLNDNNNRLFYFDVERQAFSEWILHIDNWFDGGTSVFYNPKGPLFFKFFDGYYYFAYQPNLTGAANEGCAVWRLNEYITADDPLDQDDWATAVDFYVEFTTKLYDMGLPINMKRAYFAFIEVVADEIDYEFFTESHDITDLTAATNIDVLTISQAMTPDDANTSTFHKLIIPSTWRRIGLHLRMKATNYDKTITDGYHEEGIESAFLLWGIVFSVSNYRVDDGFI